MLKLGGIDNRPPKADQAMGKFRVARNVYCTPDNRLIPRYSNGSKLLSYSVKCVHSISQYSNKMISFVTRDIGSGVYKYDLLEEDPVDFVYRLVPQSSSLGVSPFTTRTEDYPQQVQTLRNNNVQYYLCPYDGTMVKYDGVEMSYTGVHQPIFSSSLYASPGSQKTIKVVQHRIDFDQNILWSEAVSFPVLDAATNISVRVDGGATNILTKGTFGSSVGSAVSEQIIVPKIGGDNYFKDTSVVYYTALPVTGAVGITYATIGNNKWYYWNGAAYILIATMPVISTTLGSLPSIGEYSRIYKVTIPAQPLKYYRWQVNQRQTLFYNSISLFPVTGNIALAYFARDTQLTYFWTGSAYSVRLNGGEYVELVSGTTYSNIQYTNSNKILTITAADSNITPDNSLSYVILTNDFDYRVFTGTANYKYETVAYQIGSVENIEGVTTILLDNNSVKAFDVSTGWADISPTFPEAALAEPAGGILRTIGWQAGSRTFFTFWASTSPNGSFTRKGSYFSFPDSTRYAVSTVFDVTTATITTANEYGFVPGATLNEIFNVRSAPLSANEIYEYGDTPLTSMTLFDGRLIASSNSLVWYTGPELPNRFEMFNTLSTINVGSLEYGSVTAICGTNEFLFVSRQRKNYYITGNLTTRNIRIQNITETEAGAWGNSSAISVKDSVIFLTSKGVYQTVEGGRTSLVSDTCPKNFNTFDENSVNEDVAFKVSGFYANPLDGSTSDNSICIAYDEFRDLLVFMQKTAGNPCLVLSTKTKDFYEWNGMIQTAGESANCISFIFSKYYLGGHTTANSTANNYVENKTLALSYLPTYPVKLYTTWLTGGEPSLEKNLLQLKIFGRIDSDGTTQSIDVCHYKDWNLTTKITNSAYFPNDTSLSLNNQIQYSHKKRLNSDKVLAASVGVEINNPFISFEIESLEVEFTPIQQGMKK